MVVVRNIRGEGEGQKIDDRAHVSREPASGGGAITIPPRDQKSLANKCGTDIAFVLSARKLSVTLLGIAGALQ